LENNAMQSCASAAGSMTGAGVVNAIPALMMLNPAALPTNHWSLAVWIGVISLLGVFLAVPAKRQMINIEQLRFPSGIAAATTLRTLHQEGGGAAARQARSLGLGVLLGAIISWFRDANAARSKVRERGHSGFGWVKVTGATWASWIQWPRLPGQWLPGDW